MTATDGYVFFTVLGMLIFGVAYVGFRQFRVQTVDDLVTAGRRSGMGLIAASVTASWVWTTTILGSSEAGMLFGITGGFHYAWGAVVPFVIFIPVALRLRRIMPRATTFTQFIRARYGRTTHTVFILFGAGVAFYVYTEQLIGAGILFRTTFGVPYEVAVVLTAGLVTAYIAMGGLRSSLVTDLLQFVVLGIASLVVLPWLLAKLGGPSALFEGLTQVADDETLQFHNPDALNWLSTAGFRYGLAAVVIAMGQVLLEQGYYQRAIAAASNRTLARGYLVGGVLAWFPIPLVYGTLVGGGGLALGLTVGNELQSTTEVAPYLMSTLLGPIGALMFAAMTFMAATSTADTSLGGIQALLTVDVFEKYGGIDGSSKVRIGRAATVFVGAAGAVVALPAGDVSLLFYDIFSGIIFAAPVAALLAGMFTRRVSATVALISIGTGLSLGLGLWFGVDNPDLNWFVGNMASLLAPCAVIGLAVLMSKRKVLKNLKGAG